MSAVNRTPPNARGMFRKIMTLTGRMFRASHFWMIFPQITSIAFGLVCGWQVLITRSFFDVITQQAGKHTGITGMLWPTLFFGGVFLLAQLLGGIDQFLESPALSRFECEIKKEVGQKAARIDPIEFETPYFLNILGTTVRFVYGSIQVPYRCSRLFTFYIPYLTVTAVFYFSLRPELLIGVFVIFIPAMLTLMIRSKLYAKLEKEVAPLRRRYEYAEKAICDREFFKETRLLGAFGLLRGIYDEAVGVLNAHTWKAEKRITTMEVGLRLITLVGYIGILWMMFSYLLDGKISVGEFAAVFSSIGMLIGFIEQIMEILNYAARLTQYVSNIDDFFRLPERGGTEKEPTAEGIELRNVTFRYPGREEDAIRGVTLTIQPGETIAIVGDNGAGKTTLMRLISGLYLPKSGSVKVGGLDTKEVSRNSIYRQFSAVFQQYQRYRLKLNENVFISDYKNTDVVPALDKAHVEMNPATFPDGPETMLSREFSGVDLSGGQWQRVAIARGYHREHAIILLDEPTAAIDPVEESKIYSQFADISNDKTAIIVTHRMGSAKIADRIVVMKDGMIDDIGSHDELVAHGGHYAEMWKAQAQWYKE